MKRFLCIIVPIIFLSCSTGINSFKSEVTKKENRIKFETELKNKIEQSIEIKEENLSAEKLESTFWAMELLQYRTDECRNFIKFLIDNYNSYSSSQQRAILEVIYSLYPNDFPTEIQTLLSNERNPKNFAMMSNYLLLNGFPNEKILKITMENFAEHQDNPILSALKQQIEFEEKQIVLPPVDELLNHRIEGDYFYIYSFQRKNRDYRGITIVKNQYNRFIRDEVGKIFFIKHFARAITNLPGYLTNGNTPQGVLSFQGFANSKNVFIGPTTNLQLGLPYEFSPAQFFSSEKISEEWNLNLYKSLFPKSWWNYFPIQQAYLAGKAGRTEIIAHGSTINPEFYKDKIYFPYTPSQGCMTAFEKWSDVDGSLLESDQFKLYEAVKRTNCEHGFLYLIELDDKQSDVRFEEIEKFIQQKL